MEERLEYKLQDLLLGGQTNGLDLVRDWTKRKIQMSPYTTRKIVDVMGGTDLMFRELNDLKGYFKKGIDTMTLKKSFNGANNDYGVNIASCYYSVFRDYKKSIDVVQEYIDDKMEQVEEKLVKIEYKPKLKDLELLKVAMVFPIFYDGF